MNIVSFSGGKDSTAMLFMMLEKGIQIDKIISNRFFREGIQSPNGTENPLNDDIIPDLRVIKEDLDSLIKDVSKEIYNVYFEKGQLIYS